MRREKSEKIHVEIQISEQKGGNKEKFFAE